MAEHGRTLALGRGPCFGAGMRYSGRGVTWISTLKEVGIFGTGIAVLIGGAGAPGGDADLTTGGIETRDDAV